jgi:hypothetical protein
MPIFVKYQYQIAGENDIKRSMTSVADHAERQGQRAAKAQQRQRSGISGTGAANSNASAREAEAMYRAQENAAKKSEVMRERSEKRSADRAIKEHARAEREQTRATEKEARNRSQIEERWASKNRQLKDQHIKSLAAREIEEARIVQRSRASLANTLMRGGSNAARTVASVGRGALAVSGIGGTALAANALHEGMKVERAAGGMANQMAGEGESPEQIAARRKGIIASAEHVRGFSTYDAIQAARTFGGASGSYAGGQKITQDLSEISLATDVDLQDIAKLAGNTYNKFKTPDMSETEAQKQTLAAVRIFAGQGNVGSVEIKDLAMYGGRLTAGASKFQGDKLTNMARMGALAQVAAGPGEAADAAEATESAMRFASDITEHTGRIEKLSIRGKKVSAFTDKSQTQLRGIKELIGDVLEGTGGSLPQMQDIFGARSQKMTAAFQQRFVEAERANEALPMGDKRRQEKGKAGRAAAMSYFDTFDKAALKEDDQKARAEAALSTTSMQVEEAMKRLNSQLAAELLPKLPPLISALSKATPTIVDFVSGMTKLVSWAMENPFSALGSLISAAILKEILAAQIGNVIKNALGGGTGGGAGAGALGSALGKGAAVAGAGIAAFTITDATLNILGSMHDAQAATTNSGLANLSQNYMGERGKILNDTALSEEERGKKLSALGNQTGANLTNTMEANSNWLSALPDWMRNVMEGSTNKSNEDSAKAFQAQIAKDQQEAARMMLAAAEKMGANTVAGAKPGRGDSPTPVVR